MPLTSGSLVLHGGSCQQLRATRPARPLGGRPYALSGVLEPQIACRVVEVPNKCLSTDGTTDVIQVRSFGGPLSSFQFQHLGTPNTGTSPDSLCNEMKTDRTTIIATNPSSIIISTFVFLGCVGSEIFSEIR